jgi:hypothetical protein
MKNSVNRLGKIAMPVLLMGLLAGCATNQQMAQLNKSIADLKSASDETRGVAQDAAIKAAAATKASDDARNASAAAVKRSDEAAGAADRAVRTSDEAKSASQAAVQRSDEAAAASARADTTSAEARTTALSALTSASNASDLANSAVKRSEEAFLSADRANGTSDAATTAAQAAVQRSDEAAKMAERADNTSGEAKRISQAAQQRSEQAHNIAEFSNAVSERAIKNSEQAKQFSETAKDKFEATFAVAKQAEVTAYEAASTAANAKSVAASVRRPRTKPVPRPTMPSRGLRSEGRKRQEVIRRPVPKNAAAFVPRLFFGQCSGFRREEPSRRRPHRAGHHRREGARTRVAEFGSDVAHGLSVGSHRERAGEQHLPAPLREGGAEFLTEEPCHRSGTGARFRSPCIERRVTRRFREHALAERAESFVARQVDTDRHRTGTTQFIEHQRGEVLLAVQIGRTETVGTAATRDRIHLVRTRVERHHERPQQRRDFQHPALPPRRLVPSRHTGTAAPRGLVQVQRPDIAVLDHRHRVLDAGGNPQRPRRRHDEGPVLDRQAHDARRRHRDLRPVMAVRQHLRVGPQDM